MPKTSPSQETYEKGMGESPNLALLANGSSGRWSVTLDESTEGTEHWFLQIEGPSLNLFCEVNEPDILHRLGIVLESSAIKPALVLVLGQVNRIPLRVQWDLEDDQTLFFTVGPASRPLVRYAISGPDIRALAEATHQAALDL